MEILPTGLPDTGPDEPVVTFAMLTCRACGEHGPWVRTDEHEDVHAWDVEHQAATGHSHFYLWTLGRNTARIFRV
ncbi:hypothetical protein FHS43_006187 [Streptosporangium becharense]|uniref:Uncharacterized protein n=1 Tax=Streptosporangium becharense TaxID=1816182 RepID=A0A7W9IHU5_9ACTN|nr:hypothetical protein [Streptosporangium becharense]MBB2914875.1 hypothetical protein [Streptosporangium becharense]MBB5820314.1 hypothetical protein [Streptosporangium becharense]